MPWHSATRVIYCLRKMLGLHSPMCVWHQTHVREEWTHPSEDYLSSAALAWAANTERDLDFMCFRTNRYALTSAGLQVCPATCLQCYLLLFPTSPVWWGGSTVLCPSPSLGRWQVGPDPTSCQQGAQGSGAASMARTNPSMFSQGYFMFEVHTVPVLGMLRPWSYPQPLSKKSTAPWVVLFLVESAHPFSCAGGEEMIKEG